MGTTLHVRVATPTRAEGIAAIEAVFAEVRRLELVLSTWRDDSEISALNRAPVGHAVLLSGELHRLLAEASAWSARTDGAFDPAVGSLVDAWDLRGAGRRPSAAELERARRSSGVARFELNAATGSAARRDSAAWLDTGGFGKGAALREAGRLLAARGIRAAMLNFGGQVLALGGDERGHPWRVPVAHPALRHRPAASLAVRGRSVSTTSQSERAVTVGGRRVGHVLDPRSGEPVPAWGSVTVVAEDPVTADILSTALLVMGADEALRWAQRRSDVGVLVLEDQGGRVRPRWNDGLEQYLADNPILTRGG